MPSHEDMNYIFTLGSFGKVRRAPYYTIFQQPNGYFGARDDLCKNKSIVVCGCKTPDDVARLLKGEIEKRTRLY